MPYCHSDAVSSYHLSFTVLNVETERYRRCANPGKIKAHSGFGTILGLRSLLEILKCVWMNLADDYGLVHSSKEGEMP